MIGEKAMVDIADEVTKAWPTMPPNSHVGPRVMKPSGETHGYLTATEAQVLQAEFDRRGVPVFVHAVGDTCDRCAHE